MCSPIKQGFHGVFHPDVCEIPTHLLLFFNVELMKKHTHSLHIYPTSSYPLPLPKGGNSLQVGIENPSFNLDAFNNLWCNWEAMDLFVIAKK
jgi:hypothetical protein